MYCSLPPSPPTPPGATVVASPPPPPADLYTGVVYVSSPPAPPGGTVCGCPDMWLGDGWCDEYESQDCNVPECGYDGGDCAPHPPAPPMSPPSACPCPASWLGDGLCDATLGCDIADCDFDGGDCEATPPSPPGLGLCGCPIEWIGDGYCDDSGEWNCNTLECTYDGGDCTAAAPPSLVPLSTEEGGCNCPAGWIGDGWCDAGFSSYNCYSPECQNDGGDCAPLPPPVLSPPFPSAGARSSYTTSCVPAHRHCHPPWHHNGMGTRPLA